MKVNIYCVDSEPIISELLANDISFIDYEDEVRIKEKVKKVKYNADKTVTLFIRGKEIEILLDDYDYFEVKEF